jgi:hypothetical protein
VVRNGDLRSGHAAGSGDRRRARARPLFFSEWPSNHKPVKSLRISTFRSLSASSN